MELARKTAGNAVYGLVNFAWPIVLAIVSTPYILRGLGEEGYGLLMLALAAVGFLGLLDLGMGAALVKYVSEYYAHRDFAAVNRAFGASLLFYGAIGVAGAAVALLAAPVLAERVLDVPDQLVGTARTVFYVIGVSFFFTMLLNVFASVPSSVQRFDVRAKVHVLYTTVFVGTTVLLVYLDRGVLDIVLANLAITVLGIVTYAIVNRRLLPLGLVPRADLPMMRRMLSFGSFAFVSAASGVVFFYLDKLIVGALLGVGAVAFYAIPASLAIRVHQSVSYLALVVFPVASELTALNDRSRLHRLYERATRLVFAFVAAVSIPPLVFAHTILEEWIGADFAARSGDVFLLLILAYVLLAFSVVPSYIAHGAGRPQVAAASAALMSVLNVVLLLVLVPRYELVGAALAFLLSFLVVPVFVAFVERRLLGLSSAMWARLVARVLPVAAVQVAVCLLLRAVLPDGLLPLLAALLVGFAVFPFVYLVFGFAHPDDRRLASTVWNERVLRNAA